MLAELGNLPLFATAHEQRENIEVIIQTVERLADVRIGALIAIAIERKDHKKALDMHRQLIANGGRALVAVANFDTKRALADAWQHHFRFQQRREKTIGNRVALQPGAFHIVRSAAISAPQREVFDQVNDFHKWEAWSPWAKLDPAARNSIEGPAAGTGAIFTWSGNKEVGEGRIELGCRSHLKRLRSQAQDACRPLCLLEIELLDWICSIPKDPDPSNARDGLLEELQQLRAEVRAEI